MVLPNRFYGKPTRTETAILHGIKLPEVLPYCIDTSQARKVFSMEWADDGRTYIISFKRGPWEIEFLTAVK